MRATFDTKASALAVSIVSSGAGQETGVQVARDEPKRDDHARRARLSTTPPV
ncbi:MAG TPA: hypothetical protein VLM85_19080 [Polyangiaceae bacterium]|nr:hypothetical protein [Polyangiaceae bacterium]